MPRAQFLKRGRKNGAFEMKMQFRLGQTANEISDVSHRLSLVAESEENEIHAHGTIPESAGTIVRNASSAVTRCFF